MNIEVTAKQYAERVSDLDWQKMIFALPPRMAARVRCSEEEYRRFVEAVVWVACNYAFWSELPSAYGQWRATYVRYMRWLDAGIWTAIDRDLASDSVWAVAFRLMLEKQLHQQLRRRSRIKRKVP